MVPMLPSDVPSGIDELDARLIRALVDTPRAGVMELARQLSVARGTVQARLDKLQQRGVVAGFDPDVDLSAIGYKVLAFVGLEITQGWLDEVGDHLRAIPEVLEILDAADRAGCTVHLPYDVVVAKEFAPHPPSLRTCNVHEVADDEMILGTVGDDSFRDFTIIGPAVNLAAALVDAARDGQRILCDMLTVGALTDKSIVQAEGPRKFGLEKPGPLLGLSYDIYRLSEPAVQPLTQPTDGSRGEFDAFFSYRREGGSPVVRSVQQALKDQFRIFVDVDKLGSGHFDTRLLDTIAQAPSFVVFLSQGSLDRCQHQEDWLRKEIAQAIRTGRNIVPVTLPGFTFPPQEALPEDIREVTRHDAVEYSHRYFNAMVEKIRERLTPVKRET